MSSYFVSWSGGKDSCLALHRALETYGSPSYLLTMMIPGGERSRSHGLRRDVILAQAHALHVTPLFLSATWADYQDVFISELRELSQQGIHMGVFGDIRIENDPVFDNHRHWADHVCESAGMTAFEPLWHRTEYELVQDFLSSGISALIVAVKDGLNLCSFLGTPLTKETCLELQRRGIHPLGERGEFHTLVINSPHFSEPLDVVLNERVLRDGYWFLDVTVRSCTNEESDH